MISVREAVNSARHFLVDLYEGSSLDDLAVEEVEYNPDNNAWDITLGFWRRIPQPKTLGGVDAFKVTRVYKVVSIHSGSGEVSGMRIREFENSPHESR